MNITQKVIDTVSRRMGSDVISSINRFVGESLFITENPTDMASVAAAYRAYSAYEDHCVDWLGLALYIIDNFPGIGVVRGGTPWGTSEYFFTGCQFQSDKLQYKDEVNALVEPPTDNRSAA